MCKHLVSIYSSPHPDLNGKYIVRAPPGFTRGLFRERLPLILLSECDNGDTSSGAMESARSDSELINSFADDDEPILPSYAEELDSFALMASENPEINERDDESLRELREIMNWATGDGSRSNPRMQSDVCSFIRDQKGFVARYKRPYEEEKGSTRSGDGQTMRDAARSYYFMRPQNLCHRPE
ncbi:hypothetical protein V1509DRAFT_650507 [Lipomyces kononenkoae]